MSEVAVHDRIRAAREAAGINQDTAAVRVGVSRSQFQKWEAGTSKVPHTGLIAMARLYAVSSDYLLGLTDVLAPHQESPGSRPGDSGDAPSPRPAPRRDVDADRLKAAHEELLAHGEAIADRNAERDEETEPPRRHHQQ